MAGCTGISISGFAGFLSVCGAGIASVRLVMDTPTAGDSSAGGATRITAISVRSAALKVMTKSMAPLPSPFINRQAIAEVKLLERLRAEGVFTPPEHSRHFARGVWMGGEVSQSINMERMLIAINKIWRENGGDPKQMQRLLLKMMGENIL